MKRKRWFILIVLVVVVVSVFLSYKLAFEESTDVSSDEPTEFVPQESDDVPFEEPTGVVPEESADVSSDESADFLPEESTDDFSQKRMQMVELQLKGRDILDEKVLEAMGRLPRHKFVDESLWDEAYADYPLPIGEGQTISQPYVVALMTQALNLNGSEKVLEIGTGSGYQAAVLAEIVEEVYTVEIREKLAEMAENSLSNLGYTNVHVQSSDGYFGWEEHAPYDAIIITCAVNHIPPPLISQLKEGGRLILPLGPTTYYQSLTLLQKTDEGLSSEYITSVLFVPMIGEALED
ncbi:MAG: protein-L-isoaspartate(D-aspartate) O-methyltransferase [Candidatus Bathyarchaeota archaeon]|nr:protein-L-isoaspartate(D-aspartate) O-methyltransferase [Candidatus Bathyarchaeota archaeon]